MTTSPKAQAEAMARELLHSRIHSNTKFEDTLSTALEKLLTENEKAQKKVDQYFTGLIAAERAFQETKSQLTATEAKLSRLKEDCGNSSRREKGGSEVRECPKCGTKKTFGEALMDAFGCGSQAVDNELSFQSLGCAELTKLKADVERLRGTVKEVHDRMHYLLEPDEDGELDMKEVRGCVEDYLGMLARALEETK